MQPARHNRSAGRNFSPGHFEQHEARHALLGPEFHSFGRERIAILSPAHPLVKVLHSGRDRAIAACFGRISRRGVLIGIGRSINNGSNGVMGSMVSKSHHKSHTSCAPFAADHERKILVMRILCEFPDCFFTPLQTNVGNGIQVPHIPSL